MSAIQDFERLEVARGAPLWSGSHLKAVAYLQYKGNPPIPIERTPYPVRCDYCGVIYREFQAKCSEGCGAPLPFRMQPPVFLWAPIEP